MAVLGTKPLARRLRAANNRGLTVRIPPRLSFAGDSATLVKAGDSTWSAGSQPNHIEATS